MNGVILLPTLNRTHLLQRFLDSFVDTGALCDVRVLIDSCDYEKNKTAYDRMAKAYNETNIVFIDTGDAVTMGDKCRFIIPKLKAYKWIGLLNDDHVCATKHWDSIVDELCDGTNMVSSNDGFWNFGMRVCGITVWGASLLESASIPIFPPGLHHWFIDDVWAAIGNQTGCWHETMRINFPHKHVFKGEMEMDETAKIAQDGVRAQEQLKVFQEWMKVEFPKVCERINELRRPKHVEEKFT